MRVRCAECGNTTSLTVNKWRCDCGGAWEPGDRAVFDPEKIDTKTYSIWRYGEFLGLDIKATSIPMGVGWTPLVPIQFAGLSIYLKLEYLSPSGSFKDRGVNAMVNQLKYMGVEAVIEDSSGNAGASLAAHAARFGLQAKIFVPAYASPAKQHQIRVYGAEVVPIEGPRDAAKEAAWAASEKGQAYASHAYHPAYLAGQMTAAYELWEQLGRQVPDWIVLPVAQGGQLLGYWIGFRDIREAGFSDRMPRLVAVQSERVAPLFKAWQEGLASIPAVSVSEQTIAEGIAITKPIRGKRLLQALQETNGLVLTVNEIEILNAQKSLGHMGYYVEPTSAVALAGLEKLKEQISVLDTIVVPLTGNGLKGAPNILGMGGLTSDSHAF